MLLITLLTTALEAVKTISVDYLESHPDIISLSFDEERFDKESCDEEIPDGLRDSEEQSNNSSLAKGNAIKESADANHTL